MKTKLTTGLLICCVFIAWPLYAKPQSSEAPKSDAAYTVADDRRIYVVDINAGKLIEISTLINGLGRPSSIEINPSNNHLYIGSEVDHRQKHNDALIELDPSQEFAVVRKFLTESEPKVAATNANRANKFNDAVSVYNVTLSPDGKFLHVGDSINAEKGVITLINIENGQTMGWTNFVLGDAYLVSPDKKQVAVMWPSGERSDIIDGQRKTRSWQGGVAVGNLQSNHWLPTQKLINNRGFQPPWAKLTSPFIYLDMSNRHLLTYHRDSGQLLSEIDIRQLTKCGPTQTYPTLLENPNHIALAMSCSQEEGAVVVIDVIEQKLIHKIKVGPFPTNVVVAKY